MTTTSHEQAHRPGAVVVDAARLRAVAERARARARARGARARRGAGVSADPRRLASPGGLAVPRPRRPSTYECARVGEYCE